MFIVLAIPGMSTSSYTATGQNAVPVPLLSSHEFCFRQYFQWKGLKREKRENIENGKGVKKWEGRGGKMNEREVWKVKNR